MSIVEVAKLAGVSFSTVSRVINGRPNVSPKTVEIVMRAMKKANYQPPHPSRRRGPNSMARQGIYTQTVAMLFTGMKEKRLSNKPAMSDVMHSVQRCLAEHDMNMVAAFVDRPGDLPPMVIKGELDGILVCGYQPSEEMALVLGNLPGVWVMSPPSGYSSTVDCVYPDDEAIGKLAAEYLIGEGRKQLVCLSGVSKYGGFGVRAEAFLRYGINHGADVEIIGVEDVGLDVDDPSSDEMVHPKMIDKIVDRAEAVSGIFLITDLMAARTYRLLRERGIEPGDAPETLNLSHPEHLQEVAATYLDAGAQIIQTNTFGASPIKLADSNLADQTEAINRAAVQAVRKAVGDRALISGSMGPCGKLLEPYGEGQPDGIRASFYRQATALVEGSVDLICIETMIDLAEAELAVAAVKEAAPHIPVMVTMTFDSTPNGYFTMMGNPIAHVAQRLEAAGVSVVGSNCGNGLEHMIAIGGEFVKTTNLPVLIQSNAGLPKNVDGETVYLETPDFFRGKIAGLIDAGVRIIGGCCGTTPEHIRMIRNAVNSLA